MYYVQSPWTIGIYWVSTVPSERRQGIASSLIMYLLKLIAVSGYRFVVIQANGQGKEDVMKNWI